MMSARWLPKWGIYTTSSLDGEEIFMDLCFKVSEVPKRLNRLKIPHGRRHRWYIRRITEDFAFEVEHC
jgi:hypothetical protein